MFCTFRLPKTFYTLLFYWPGSVFWLIVFVLPSLYIFNQKKNIKANYGWVKTVSIFTCELPRKPMIKWLINVKGRIESPIFLFCKIKFLLILFLNLPVSFSFSFIMLSASLFFYKTFFFLFVLQNYLLLFLL